jgi:hypothetical protein
LELNSERAGKNTGKRYFFSPSSSHTSPPRSKRNLVTMIINFCLKVKSLSLCRDLPVHREIFLQHKLATPLGMVESKLLVLISPHRPCLTLLLFSDLVHPFISDCIC